MNALLIYDVSTRKADVKQELIRLGYYDRWLASEKRYYLPNSSVWKPNIELNAALLELNGVISRLNSIPSSEIITLLRCIVVSTMPWDGIEGHSDV